MNKTAFKRGAKAAAFYKCVSRTAKTLNSASVSWAVRHGMPSFIGRLPVPLIGIILATLGGRLENGKYPTLSLFFKQV